MDDFESVVKASWSKETLHIFCDICIRAIDMGMRPSSHFDRRGWKYIVTSFREQTGQPLTKDQLKNKWDVCKKDWRAWIKLIGETGVGWSNELGTIVASDEWWKARIQENRGVNKFRQSGIEPSLKFKFDRMFSGVTATGQYAWAPSSGALPGSDDDLDKLNVGLQCHVLEEGSGDSDENDDLNFDNNNTRGVGGSIYLVVPTERAVENEKKESSRSQEVERKSHLPLVLN